MLVMGGAQPVAAARRSLARRWRRGTAIGAYVADPRRVVLARNIALVVTEQGVNVMHRGHDGAWRYAIVLHVVEESNGRERTMIQETIRTRRYSRWPWQGRGRGALVVRQPGGDQGDRR